jgi:hypothetical protein
VLQASQPAPPPPRPRHGKPAPPAPALAHDSFDLLPVDLDLGGSDSATLTGHVDDTGYTLNLAGSVLPSRLLAVGKAVPQLGDGLGECLPASAPSPDSDTTGSQPAPPEAPIHIDLTAKRAWGNAPSWCPDRTVPPPPDAGKPSKTEASN